MLRMGDNLSFPCALGRGGCHVPGLHRKLSATVLNGFCIATVTGHYPRHNVIGKSAEWNDTYDPWQDLHSTPVF